jgi:Endo-alpha-N-acetylgalactosaminidase
VKAVPGFAAGLAAELPEVAAQGLRKPPVRPVTLRSNLLTATLDGKDGLPFHYLFDGETIWGEDTGAPIAAIVCRLRPRSYVAAAVRVVSVARTQSSAVVRFQVPWDEEIGAEFSLRYAIAGASLTMTLESVVEHPGFELIELSLPSLATVRETDEGAWMAQGRDGGSFVRVAEAKPYRYKDDEYFGRISTQLPIGMVGTRRAGCLMAVTGFMDGTETSVATTAGGRSARVGTVLVHRVHGGRCYNMNGGGNPVCGMQQTPNLLVGQASPCRFDFYRVDDAAVPWFRAAKLLCARMPPSPTRYFDDKLLYLIAGKQKTETGPRTTFAQSRTLIRDIARLTDYAPQVAYISGWVYDGQDTGYPSEDKVNASLGSYEELMELMADGRRVNANVSVNVNYDDAYKSSPEFDPAFIAREPDGAIWKSRAWDGEDSYVVGMAKYVLGGWAMRRIAATMARYKLRDAILIDALSWFTIRNDWDPAHPASGYTNLVEGKWRVLEEFRKRGVSVTSEQFRYPMLGKLALSVNGPEPRPCPFGGQQVPLTAIVYRRAAIFGSSGDGALRPQQDLFWNSRPGLWFENKTDRAAITDFYYLLALPFNKVHRLEVESFATRGSVRELRFDAQSKITMDTAGTSYEVVWQGATIARDDSTCCPVDANRIAFYCRSGGRMHYPLPAAWTAAKVTARALTADGRTAFPVRIEAGQLVVEPPARVPVMVYASEEAMPDPEAAV